MKKKNTPFLCIFSVFLCTILCLGEEIHELARNGELEKIRALLKKNPGLANSQDSLKRTPLHCAAQSGNAATVNLILSLGGDIAIKDTQGEIPLHYAAQKGDMEIVERLIEAGSDLNALNNMEQTPLFNAILSGSIETCVLLKEKGAQIDTKDRHGWTPLLFAAWSGHDKIVSMLLSAGADASNTDGIGWTPLHAACFGGHLETVKLLADPGLIESPSQSGDRPLHWAIGRGHRDVVAYLLRKGADKESLGAQRLTAIQLAAWLGHVPIIELLLEEGSDIHVLDEIYGRNLIQLAILRNQKDVVHRLLETSIDLEHKDKTGRTARDWADRLDLKEIQGILEESGPKMEPFPQLHVTWISNAGFLISTGKHKVLADPLFGIQDETGKEKDSLQSRFESAQDPFDQISLILITHYHGDHLAPIPVGKFLTQSPRTVLFGSRRTALQYEMMSLPGFWEQTKHQITAVTPNLFSPMNIITAGIKTSALHCLHEVETPDNAEAENLAYLFEIDGWRVLHVGDIESRRSRPEDFSSFGPLTEKGVDLVFLPAGFLDNPLGADIIRNVFRPRYVVLMHYGPGMAASLKKSADRLQKGLPPIVVFEKEGQTHVFDH